MRKQLRFLAAFGTGYAIIRLLQYQQREIRVRQWARVRPRKALVTGASSGIGAAFARALARQGCDLVLLARREDRLRALAEELHHQFGVQVEVLAADLSNTEDLERAADQIALFEDLDLLINNAGFGVPGRFEEVDPRRNMEMVQVNLAAPVRLARAVIPGMVRRGRGGIINVSSVAGFVPSAGNHTYGATKAYLNFFTRSLQSELEGTGVRVQALCPGYTYSEFHDAMGTGRPQMPGFLWLSAEQVAAESLRGLEEGRLIVVPGAVYKLAVALSSIPGAAPLIKAAERALRALRSRGQPSPIQKMADR